MDFSLKLCDISVSSVVKMIRKTSPQRHRVRRENHRVLFHDTLSAGEAVGFRYQGRRTPRRFAFARRRGVPVWCVLILACVPVLGQQFDVAKFDRERALQAANKYLKEEP